MTDSLVPADVLERVLRECSERAGRYNSYLCPEGHRTRVVLRDTGHTPAFLGCRQGWQDGGSGCRHMAHSCFYNDPRGGVPKWQWIRPSRAEFEGYVTYWRGTVQPEVATDEKMIDVMREHVETGGLVLVPIGWKP